MFLNLLLDVILLTVLIGGSYYGYKQGFFRMAAGAVRGALCLLISFSLCDRVGTTLVSPLIRGPIRRYLLDFLRERTFAAETTLDRIPMVMRIAGVVFGVDSDNSPILLTAEAVVNALGEPTTTLIARVVAFILLFIFLKYILRLLVFLADSFLALGIIGKLNRLLGGAVSVCIAFFGAWVFTSAVEYLFHLKIFTDSRLVNDFDGGPIYRLIKEFSLLRLLLSF